MNQPLTECAEPSQSKIPQEIVFKPAFIERYKLLLGNRFDDFIRFSSSYIRKCIRVNTLKITVEEVKKRLEKEWILEPIPWCPEGFYITYRHGKRFDIGNLIEHQLGYIYVQDAASMIPPIILDPQPGEQVLDLCSAPGSKTTQIAQYMKNEGILVANDVQIARLRPLGLNLQRCGVKNCIVTIRSNNRLKSFDAFDRILVDAPCSGTGTIRRSLKTMQMWSPGLVKKISRDQRNILRQGYALLKQGGTMVYSTCTHEPEENEAIVSWLLEQFPDMSIVPFELNIKRSPAVLEWNGKAFHPDVKHCLRIYPQDNDTEGFFVAKLRKNSRNEQNE